MINRIGCFKTMILYRLGVTQLSELSSFNDQSTACIDKMENRCLELVIGLQHSHTRVQYERN